MTGGDVLEHIRNKLVPGRRTGWTGKRHQNLLSLGYEPEEEYLQSVIKHVVKGNNEGVKVSTSIIVYGSPGCGKSQLVDKAVAHVQTEFGKETFLVAHLDGVYCFNLQDSISELSHQLFDLTDINNSVDNDNIGITDSTSFDDKLEGILLYIKTKLIEMKKSLVIVIDGMEKFTDDSSQKLLYNLFDISANEAFSVPICIIGITPCVDILDSFEKRVKSRFSHRQINLIPKVEFSTYKSWAKNLLTHSENSKSAQEWNHQVQIALEDNEVTKSLRLVYDADKSIGQLRRFLYFSVLLSEGTFDPSLIRDTYSQLYGSKSHVQMALDLPLSELVVLLGIFKKVNRTYQAWQPAEAFEIVKKPYALYQLKQDDFIKTIIKLQELGMVVPVGSTQSRNVNNLFEAYFKCEISFEEFQVIWKKYPNLPSFFNEFL